MRSPALVALTAACSAAIAAPLAIGVHDGSLSALDAGFVTRKRCERDERSVVVSLTDAGRSLEKKAAAMQKKLLDELDMSLRERLTLHELARRLYTSR